MNYKITWFNSKAQRVEDKEFTTWDEAYEWAKENLENYYQDGIIQPIR